MRIRLCSVLAGLGIALASVSEPRPNSSSAASGADSPAEFAAPQVILDGSEHGSRLYPQFGDFDGDGITDRLVGVGDRLLVYRNRGTNARPEYAKPAWFDEIEPSARIPAG